MRVRFFLAFIACSVTAPGYAGGQTMQQLVNRLFVFSGGESPLFLAGSAGLPGTQVHGDHYIPAETESNAALLSFFERSISANVAAFPLSSTVASQTYQFVNGVPRATSSSFGPIYAERAQTVGRGRFNVGANASRIAFSRLRGVPLSDVRLTFVHQNVNFPNCNVVFQGNCEEYGIPQFEHDVIDLNLELDIAATVFALYGTFGITDWLDVAVAVPIVSLSLDGRSVASIVPASGAPVQHFFAGTPENPLLFAETSSHGDATGVGDVAIRGKAQFLRGGSLDLALLGEVRVPTGRTEDFLGTGEWGWRGLFIASGQYGAFSPHTNLGFTRRGGHGATGLFEGVIGFDQRMAPWATLALDLMGLFTAGDVETEFSSEPIVLDEPYRQEIRLTNIPEIRDDQVNGSVGFKFQMAGGVLLIANALVPLNQGGLRSNWIATLGVEFAR